MALPKDLREFIESLNSHGVEFVDVGAHAVAFGFTSPGLSAADFVRPDAVVQLGVAPNRIDLLTAVTGVGFDEAWAGRCAGSLGGVAVSFLGYESLLKNKQATGRSKDLEDVVRLQAIRKRSGRPS